LVVKNHFHLFLHSNGSLGLLDGLLLDLELYVIHLGLQESNSVIIVIRIIHRQRSNDILDILDVCLSKVR